MASFSPEQQLLIRQAVEKYDNPSEEVETPIHRHARQLVEYAAAAAVSGGEAGARAARQVEQQERQTAIESPDILEANLEMGQLAAEIAGANMAAHTASSAAHPAQSTSAQQPIGGAAGAAPAALDAVLELEALHHCHAIDGTRRIAIMEQRRGMHAPHRLEEMLMEERPWEREAIGWEREEMEYEEMEEEMREREEEARLYLLRTRQPPQTDREERHYAWHRARMERRRERQEDLALLRRERLALQRRAASRYLAPTNTQVLYCAEQDSRPHVAC